jgi:manganese transport protein
MAGPAVVASIAYMDPGNFATNIQAGAAYGYQLLWVVLAANLIAMLFQALAARLGLVTGRNLAELCRDELPSVAVYPMWVISELAAMATDLAEFLGGALGLSLLLGLPLIGGMLLTAVLTAAALTLEKRGFRRLELLIGGFVGVIALCYVIELFLAPVDWPAALQGATRPVLPDHEALVLAVGIIGATVMPHAIFLHSGLTQNRFPGARPVQRRKLVGFAMREVVVALSVAGFVNLAMVTMAAASFHGTLPGLADIGEAYRMLTPLLGGAAAFLFLTSLIASGLSSSIVGTIAGQMIMQGFVGFRIPVWLRRVATAVPAFVVVALGVDITRALVLSQVVLSLALPVPMITLVLFSRRRDLMGEFAMRRPMTVLAAAATAAIVGLNAVLVFQAFN